MNYHDYLKTITWKKLRKTAIHLANYRCQLCNSPFNLNVHHRKYPEKLGQESVTDLIVLCRVCHTSFHDAAPKHWEKKSIPNVFHGKIKPTQKRFHLWVNDKNDLLVSTLCNRGLIRAKKDIAPVEGHEQMCKVCSLLSRDNPAFSQK